LITILWFLLTIGILVTFHEFGHYYVARRCGVKVLRFSVGFGKPLLSWKDKSGTEFVLAAIPLGGYVKMLDEREGPVASAELPYAFTQKTVGQRMAIVSAGPIANFILAIIFYFLLALAGFKGLAPVIGAVTEGTPADYAGLAAGQEIVAIDGKPTPTWRTVYEQLVGRIGDTGDIRIDVKTFSNIKDDSERAQTKRININQWLGDEGRPDLLESLGLERVEPETDWTIVRVLSDSAANRAGLKAGDQLVSVDGIPMSSLRQWINYVRARPGQTMDLSLQRNGQQLSFSLMPDTLKEMGETFGRAGIEINANWHDGMIRNIDHSLTEAIAYGFSKTYDQAMVILSFLKKLLFLDISVKNMGGTFTIAQAAGDTASAGWHYYLSFLAALSVSLGVFNLLPIPVLDGGHLLFYAYEAIKGKPLSEKKQIVGYQIGLFVILSVMLIAHYNDLVRLLS
jgi:regulator of sigma E protease